MGIPANWTFSEAFAFFAPRLLAAIFCGGLIGIERELKNKAAGLKTNMLICFGSTLYASLSLVVAQDPSGGVAHGDPGRIAAQIVTGVGFLGGGAIIQSRGTILGLTTAATIWVVSALGVVIGLGHWNIAIATAILSIALLTATNVFEDKVLGRSLSFSCELLLEDSSGSVREAVNGLLARNDLVLGEFDLAAQENGLSRLVIRYSGHRTDHKRFILDLWSTPGVKEVRQT